MSTFRQMLGRAGALPSRTLCLSPTVLLDWKNQEQTNTVHWSWAINIRFKSRKLDSFFPELPILHILKCIVLVCYLYPSTLKRTQDKHKKKLIHHIGMDHWFYCWHSSRHSVERWENMAGDGCIHGNRAEDWLKVVRAAMELQGAGIQAATLFNRGSSARGWRCTWWPAWSPYMWARSETRAAGSHNNQCHAAQRCRNILLPGHRPSRRSLLLQGLRANKKQGIYTA